MMNEHQLHSCPKWNTCSAAICPLDEKFSKRTHLDDDRVCFFLTESIKIDAETNFKGRGLTSLYKCMQEATPHIICLHPRINRALERARQTGSRMNRKQPNS